MEENTEMNIDAILEKVPFVGSAIVVKNDKTVYSKAFGKADNEHDNEITTVFRIASDTKQFTAAAIMLLDEQGKLSVKDTLDKYFPTYSHGKEITLHQLLCMRSGLMDYTDLMAYDIPDENGNYQYALTDDDAEENEARILKMAFEQELVFTPGSQYKYCNTNYFLLAKIIEQVSGMTYEEFLTKNIFEPLEMKATGFYDSYAVEGMVVAQPMREMSLSRFFLPPSASLGAGDMLSNAVDLQKWVKVFEGGSILSDDIIKAMTTNYSGEDDAIAYGYGWMIADDGIYHGGTLLPYNSAIYILPDEKTSVILLSNDSHSDMTGVAKQIKNEVTK